MVFFIALEEEESAAMPLAEAEMARRPDILACLVSAGRSWLKDVVCLLNCKIWPFQHRRVMGDTDMLTRPGQASDKSLAG